MIKTVDGKEVLEDGERLSVRVMLMDGVQQVVLANDGVMHRPGFANLSDAAAKSRVEVYDKYNARLTSAWKNPPPVLATVAGDKATVRTPVAVDTKDQKANAYAIYDKRVSERWRGTAAAA